MAIVYQYKNIYGKREPRMELNMELESALKCSSCHRNNHGVEQCWIKNPKLRPRRKGNRATSGKSNNKVNTQYTSTVTQELRGKQPILDEQKPGKEYKVIQDHTKHFRCKSEEGGSLTPQDKGHESVCGGEKHQDTAI